MKISFLMATYNYERFIGVAIESVLSQNYAGPVECIVVDDGSTDRTAAAVARFGDSVRYMRQGNAGQASALNQAFAECTGGVIWLLDADDFSRPAKVRRVLEAFATSPEVGLVHHDTEKLFAQGVEERDFRFFSEPADGDVSHVMLNKILPWRFSPTSGPSLRREVCEVIFPLATGLT
jgi:glycosyltransferase involved in cell wall biosynthesis